MSKRQKNADDLAEIMSDQLDILTAEDVSEDQLAIADSIANMIGKSLKLAALRIAYDEHVKGGGTKIGTLEAR